MKSPRILARPWRFYHTHGRIPLNGSDGPPRVRASWSAANPWRKGVGIPERPAPATHEVTPTDVTPGENARDSWHGDRWAQRQPRPYTQFERDSHVRGARGTWKARPDPREAFLEGSVARRPYDHNEGLRMLEFHGSTYVHERFEALAARHCHPGGSAGTVGAALTEMLSLGLTPRPAFFSAALAVLAVHPNHIFRTILLNYMRKDWIDTTPEHRIHTALGLLRDGQYEMAVEEVESMMADGLAVPPYIHEILIFALANLGFIDEAITHLNHRTQQDPPPRDDIYYFLLDACAAAQHYTSTTHLWRTVGSKITPSDGTLLNILNTAARYADLPLALEVLQRLSDRKVQMSFHHFEPVVEAYAGAGDLEGAFRMVCVMEAAGVRPTRGATRGLFSALKERPGEITACVEILEKLQETYRVPVAAVNVLIEAAVETDNVSTAEVILDGMESLTPEQPTYTTLLPFFTLPYPPLPVCIKAVTLFPRSLNLPPDVLARLASRLVPYDVEAALGYLRCLDLTYKGEDDAWVAYADTVHKVTVEIVKGEDERALEFLREVARRNPAVAENVRQMMSSREL